jgi:hypothetical protein
MELNRFRLVSLMFGFMYVGYSDRAGSPEMQPNLDAFFGRHLRSTLLPRVLAASRSIVDLKSRKTPPDQSWRRPLGHRDTPR